MVTVKKNGFAGETVGALVIKIVAGHTNIQTNTNTTRSTQVTHMAIRIVTYRRRAPTLLPKIDSSSECGNETNPCAPSLA